MHNATRGAILALPQEPDPLAGALGCVAQASCPLFASQPRAA